MRSKQPLSKGICALLTLVACLCLVAPPASSASSGNIITFYRDGALLQQEADAIKGVIDIPLAAGMLEDTLRIIPAPGTRILSVETHKTEFGNAPDKELDALTEQRRRLEDRLQALETREAIFTSAAKSQSGKAPRKTKTNPDPMQTIRQGTDFAIAQLEAVYTARRKTTQDIHKIDTRLATLKKVGKNSDNSVRITVTPARGKVAIRYATTERGWQPYYYLHLTGNSRAQLQLSARITGDGRGYQVRVSSASLAESPSAETFSAQSGSAIIAGYYVPVTEERYTEGLYITFSGKMTNTSTQYLPPGNSLFFRNGVYMGKFRFAGLSSGRSTVISLGK